MLELLFLLLPVAAAYGWYMGRRSAQQNKQDEANRLSRDYVAGVNFLLSNQQDKAVDLFLDMLKEDTGTVEAHLTLGNLFRSRGEVDRAIRIHQTLMWWQWACRRSYRSGGRDRKSTRLNSSHHLTSRMPSSA